MLYISSNHRSVQFLHLVASTIRTSAILEAMLKAWAPSMTSLRNTKHANYQLQNGRMCCGWVFKQNAQGFQKMDKLSSNALKNKPLFKEWLVRIKKANLLKLGQYQICLEHFEKLRALDINPRKPFLGPDFSLSTNRLKERVLCYSSKSWLICLYV